MEKDCTRRISPFEKGNRMEISIEYCETCNYRPIAASLAVVIKKETGIQAKLISSKGQVFEVRVDSELIFSKKQLGRFPEHSEIIDVLKSKMRRQGIE